MYIKAEQKPQQFERKNEKLDRNKNQQLPDLETDFKGYRVNSDLYNKERDGSTEETLNSLKFLHKPQRVTQMRANRFPEEEVQRNTDLNKRIFSAGNDENVDNESGWSKIAAAKNHTSVESLNGSTRPPFKIELPPLSPKSTVPKSFQAEYPEAKSPGNDMNFEYDEEILIPFAPPVYKKSGELLKSSLKRRSKSLPTTPGIRSGNGVQARDGSPMLIRSKSVHFDQAAPVKYFAEDESPINVNKTEQHDNCLSFKHKPVNLMVDPEEETKMLSSGLETTSIDDDLTTVAPKGFAHPAKISSPNNGKGTNNTKLRKSKRFQNLLKNRTDMPPSKSNKKFVNGGGAHEISDRNSKNYHVVGLYSKNFPILSNKNPKSLKLNIFINLSQNKKVFLQELSLYIHRDNNYFPNSSSFNNIPNSHNGNDCNGVAKGYNAGCTRLIAGRILVKNIFYDKRVVVRYTWDSWRTTHEVECVYISDGDGILPGTNMDIFHFIIDDASKVDPRGKLEFCIHYSTRNDYEREEYWDNNNGNNYKVDVVMDGFNDPFAAAA
ncbi:AMM_1a_G0014850.mRNA.1.CDS.1 [Saccharomyces cerevisiae]|nr:BJ4_G0003910.mRNA.1.CDS.1 [Saccharomyces cerevisiae]CAI4415332.1 AMM_1a_G0014850.mRNA.1.CDS.1 [Saccharomyces cerevisiae]CAI4430363.1 CQI_4a_G0015160.mRNA.1.CDS.1 [Saccharomyces cerevisiae]CAI6624694.1 AMM_1a_G0014850.mRNA.1.CDS.1 [Saccharomyces cerevisiae]CAI7261220.1 CQI_4a_G0015160.mRNA.1.CDS.1 [Saccharomyces cerevisiae]